MGDSHSLDLGTWWSPGRTGELAELAVDLRLLVLWEPLSFSKLQFNVDLQLRLPKPWLNRVPIL